MTSPAVSVIIPAFNAATTIGKGLRSIFTEDRLALEIIVVNDGSSDGTVSVCEEMFAESSHLTRIESQTNQGPSAARNRGLDLARGDYVIFLDSDDWFEPGALWQVYSLALSTRADAVRAGYQMVFSDSTTRKGRVGTAEGSYKGRAAIEDVIVSIADGSEQGFSCLWLFERSILADIRFRSEISYMEDTILVVEALDKCSSIEITSVCLLNYAQTSGSLARSAERFGQNVKQALAVTELLFQLAQRRHITALTARRADVLQGRLERLARAFCFEIETGNLDRAGFMKLAQKLRDDSLFQTQIHGVRVSKSTPALTLLKSVERGWDRSAWLFAQLLAQAWRAYRNGRTYFSARTMKS